MNTYLISYDLIKPVKDYASLHKHLESYSQWAKPLESVWLVKSSRSAEQVRNALQEYTDNNDRVFVVDVTSRAAAWVNLPKDVSDWILNQL